MLSAISFGVFWRLAPSTIAIIRSRKASPGFALMRTISQSESTRVPPVTALRSPPLSRMTGALSPVMALSSTEATPSITSPSPGITSPASTSTTSSFRSELPGTRRDGRAPLGLRQALGLDVLARPPEGLGLGLAAPLRHRLGEVREEHGEPEPHRDPEDEARGRLALAEERLEPEPGGEDAPHEHDEHDRVPDLDPGIELPDRVDDGAPHDGAVEEGSRLRLSRHVSSPPATSLAVMSRCSTIGPSASAGTKVSAPTRSTTPIRRTTKSGVCVGSVPGPGGTVFFRASDPAIASVGIASQ